MDVYSLINSKAISEHCRRISHSFTPLETAYLVYANDTLSIRQKHAAFAEIIAERPDMEIAERPWTPYSESLRAFLRRYMALQNKYLDIFYRDEPNCVYSFAVLYSGDSDHTEDDRMYPTFASCYRNLKRDIDALTADYKKNDREISPLDIRVRKQWINSDSDEQGRYLVVCLDYDNDPMELWDSCSVISSEDSEVLCAFNGLWPEVPTPFQKGDILIARQRWGKDESPFVLDRIPYWEEAGKHTRLVSRLREHGDRSDLGADVYGLDENGAVWRDHGPSYLDLEYHTGELLGAERFLLALSNYLKGELPPELLLHSYDTRNCALPQNAD